jgi:hypothetical protein
MELAMSSVLIEVQMLMGVAVMYLSRCVTVTLVRMISGCSLLIGGVGRDREPE